ncbi:MAG TPA: TonB-dependent receptor [Allosphingosinicella sp.]|jgi:outer membrane receptor protein involved in Fe transport
MRKFGLLGTSALGSFTFIGLALAMAAPAYAQDTDASDDPAELTSEPEIESGQNAESGAAGEETITVTGSRIRRPNVESAVPITSVGGEEFFQQGQNSIGDTLNDLPQLRSTFAQQNPGAGVGIAGLNLLDLRGLGTVRTLVLVNGRRHVAADILNNASSPDVNTIPNDLIERVDIVTGGSSAVYGSDAIAGVVNFVLRRNFDGLQVRGVAGVSEAGYGGNQYVSAMFGKNFADGRGNITLHGEYAHQERIYARDIPFMRVVNGFATVDVDSAGLPNASDGFPDGVFVRDIRSGTIHRFGLAGVVQPTPIAGFTGQPAPACGQGTLANNGPPNQNGTAFTCNFVFGADGRLTPQTGSRIGAGPAGVFLGGNGQTGREGTQLSILPSNERFNANLLAHYEFSKALEFFAEAKFVRVNAVGNQLGPTFLNNSTASLGDSRIAPRLDNPFLNPADRATLANLYLSTPCTFATNTGSSFGATTCINNAPNQPGATAAQNASRAAALAARNAAIANGSFRFLFARNLTDLEDRDEIFQRDTYRIVTGIRGGFNDDWSYELSANYGKMKETADMRGFVNRQRFLLSLDAGRNPVTGQIQCRSQFDPTAAVGAAGYTDSAATLAADIAACVPYNPFGQPDNSAARAYFAQKIINHASLDQLDILGFVSGDSSQIFSMPGGPIRFVIGGEYRREKAFNNSDAAADTGVSNSVFLGDVSAKMDVKEAFAEIQIPVLRDTPFFEELTITGAGRISDYGGALGTTKAYNAGIEWSPIRDLRFRANYGRAVRAPNVSEALFPNVPNFANGFLDPCGSFSIGGNPNRSPNCTAELSPAQLANIPGTSAGYSLGIISGSNPNLQEETSDSYTVGAVITPRFLPGFSLTVDYYKITVENVIVSLTAQAIVNGCYDSPNRSSPLCNNFGRNLGTTPGPNGELPGNILFNSVFSGPQNFASRVREGIDFEMAYRANISNDVRFNTRLIYSHGLTNSNFQDPARPKFENRLLSEVGDPQDEARWNVDLTVGKFTLGYELRYIGKQLVSTYENSFFLNPEDNGPLNLDAFDIRYYPSVMYHDLRFDWKVGGGEGRSESSFFFGVDNVFNKEPPLGTTATGAGTAIFNIRGRNFYGGFRARF